eukprot:m.115856 g.115856  ORF g.115856 m.115856 type:complete len:248 (-) comp13582_c0_seq3:482-1225(-)
MTFVKGTHLLVSVSSHGTVCLFDCDSSKSVCSISLPKGVSCFGRTNVAVSDDGEWVCVAMNSTLLWYNVDTATCVGQLVLDSSVTALTYQPQSTAIVAITAKRMIHMYDSETFKATPWFKRNRGYVPSVWQSTKDKPMRFLSTPSGRRLACFGTSGITFIDTTKHFAQRTSNPQEEHESSEEDTSSTLPKRSKRNKKANDPCTRVTRYRPLLYADFVSDNALVVVERAWSAVLDTLPMPLERHRYGT